METVSIQIYLSWHGGSEEQAGGLKRGEQVERNDMAYIGRALKATEGVGSLGPQHINGGNKLHFSLIFSSFHAPSLSTCNVPGQACAKCRRYNGE